ncbi:MAG: hypothetical protein EOO41_04815, partial [Methanobacteriota archaeon]
MHRLVPICVETRGVRGAPPASLCGIWDVDAAVGALREDASKCARPMAGTTARGSVQPAPEVDVSSLVAQVSAFMVGRRATSVCLTQPWREDGSCLILAEIEPSTPSSPAATVATAATHAHTGTERA